MTLAADRLLHAEDVFGRDYRDDVLTEAGAAERFARRHGNDVRFDYRRERWLLWRGHRFEPDTAAAIYRLVLDFIRGWQHDALEVPDRDRRDAVIKFALRLEQQNAIAGLLRLARTLKPIADAGDSWDADPWLLGVPNGVVALRTGTRRDGRREDGITLRAGADFNPSATCPRFEQFVLEISNGDPELARFHQRFAGYALTGDVSEQVLMMQFGGGANGKSTLIRALLHVWADYGDVVAFQTIERTCQRSTIPNDLAALAGRRLVVASETREGARLDEGRLKSLTGGDPIRARYLNAEWFTFRPTLKLALCVNHRPVVTDDSHGFWRRVRLVPFERTFSPNPALESQLQDEAAGILAWAVRGCLDWQQHGLGQPARVQQATSDYAADSDPLASFLDEACELDEHAETSGADLFDNYRHWSERHGLSERERLTATAFGRRMGERFTRRKTRQGVVYEGVARAL
jgi:putative DNA primase/helicase